MTREKMIMGKPMEKAEIKALYEEAVKKEEAKGSSTEARRMYLESIDTLFEILNDPENIRFSRVVDMFSEISGRDKKSVNGSLRSTLRSASTAFNLEKVDGVLYVVRRS